MKVYVKTTIVGAEPGESKGRQGYNVFYPDGYVSWCPKEEFERTARVVSKEEAQLTDSPGVRDD